MLIRWKSDLGESEVTDPQMVVNRRHFILAAGVGLLGTRRALAASSGDEPTPFAAATSYNNFYEYSTDKGESARLAPGRLRSAGWTVAVDGACSRPGTIGVEDVAPQASREERIYRMRCVEGWSMVIPWLGVPLAGLLKRFEPTSKAKYVAFTSLADSGQMPNLRASLLDWPYTEGLRLDEAMHPLAFLAVGMYGREMPAQNGAPIRLVVPWKYGFKSAKSIVRISFVESQPMTSWMKAGPQEYGFYSNVNPEVDHPRWSQAKERRIGEFLRRPTLMFNGYGEQVASLYAGQNLRRDF